jgi:hypothetical protein
VHPCSADARCIAGACVTNSPPVARIAIPPGALEANLVFSFDGSASADPDPGDSVVSYAWSFRAVTAQCAPPAVAGNSQAATVRFTCAGRYAIDLTVTDQLSAQGVASTEFDVAPYSGPALLTMGADLTLDHVCVSGPPKLCTPKSPVGVSATPTPSAPADLVFAWTVEPPVGLALDANRRVTFTPGADASAPSVSIETDGQAISGNWVFHVEARDAFGVVASGATVVSIGNNPPILTKTVPVPDHTFDGAQFLAKGEVPFTVTDPDGDDLVDRTVEFHHVGDGSGTFTGTVQDAPTKVTFSIVVPFSARTDAQYLIGGPGLERSIRFSISDVNGAVVPDVWTIEVGNRSPVLVFQPTGISVDHAYDAGAVAYTAVAGLSRWSDPDGDPLWQVPGSDTGDPQCPQFDVIAGISTVSCHLAYTGTPAVANFAGTHVVSQHVQDPWAPAGSASTVTFTIGNRFPTITTAPVPLMHSSCTTGVCCHFVLDPESRQMVCDALYESCAAGGSAVISGWWQDADGDPLTVTLTGDTTKVCLPSDCSMTVTLQGFTNQCGSTSEQFRTSASDGLATWSTTFFVG